MKPQLVKPDPSPEDGLRIRLNKSEKRKSYLVPLLIAAAVHVVAIGAIAMSLSGKDKAAPKPAIPALRTEPKADTTLPAVTPVRPAPTETVSPPPAESVVAPKPVPAKPAAKPAAKVQKKAPAKVSASKKTAKATKAAQSKTARTKAAKAKPVPKKKPAPQKKASTLDLDALSKMGGKH